MTLDRYGRTAFADDASEPVYSAVRILSPDCTRVIRVIPTSELRARVVVPVQHAAMVEPRGSEYLYPAVPMRRRSAKEECQDCGRPCRGGGARCRACMKAARQTTMVGARMAAGDGVVDA